MRFVTLCLIALLGTGPLPSCATVKPVAAQIVGGAPAEIEPGSENLLLINSVVQVRIHIESVLMVEEKLDGGRTRIKETPAASDWSGTGFVIAKRHSAAGWESLIVTADHVLRAPKVGDVVKDEFEFMGETIETGSRRIEAVRRTIITDLGMTCNLTQLTEGSSGGSGENQVRDVVTASADCDAGRVAEVSHSIPVRGEKIQIIGHPAHVQDAMITEGYTIGRSRPGGNGFVLTSARVHGGNSGGPAFHQGKVFGVVAQVNPEYDQVSYIVPLEEMLRRIAETPGW